MRKQDSRWESNTTAFLHVLLFSLLKQSKQNSAIRSHPPPTTNKTIRFPNDVVERVERQIKGKECTFSAFEIAAVRSALEDLEEEQ